MTTAQTINESITSWEMVNEAILNENMIKNLVNKIKPGMKAKGVLAALKPMMDNINNDDKQDDAKLIANLKKITFKLADEKNISKAQISKWYNVIAKLFVMVPGLTNMIVQPTTWLVIFIYALIADPSDPIGGWEKYYKFYFRMVKYKWSKDITKLFWFNILMGLFIAGSVAGIISLSGVVGTAVGILEVALVLTIITSFFKLVFVNFKNTMAIIRKSDGEGIDINNWRVDFSWAFNLDASGTENTDINKIYKSD